MNNLLFLPIDIDFRDVVFDHEEKVTYHQKFWNTEKVVKVGQDYDNHRWLLDQLSLDQVTTFTHKIQQQKVDPHVDVFGHTVVTPEIQQLADNEPSGFHVVLKGQPDSLEIFDGKQWINPVLPKVPMVYLMNLLTCYHRVKHDPGRETLYIKGFINKQKHKDLIDKNLKKYPELAIFKNPAVGSFNHKLLINARALSASTK